MNNVVNNYFQDAQTLVHGYFSEMRRMYSTRGEKDKNQWAEQCFPVKLQAASLKILSKPSLM
jgi:hypothetical protein